MAPTIREGTTMPKPTKTEEDKLLDDLLNTDDDDNDNDDDLDAKALKDEIDSLKKENHGLLATVKKERTKRQHADGRLGQLTETVNNIIKTNKSGKPVEDLNKPTDTSDGIPVLYNDDGDPYLPTESLNLLLSQQKQEIDQLKEQLQITTTNQNAQSEAEKVKMAIVGENEAFGAAYSKYQTARSWVEKAVLDWQKANNISGTITSGQALDYIFDEDLIGEFSERFPDADLSAIVTGEDSNYHFRKMLETLSTESKPDLKTPNMDSKFKQVINKPSGLGKSANANNEPSVLEKVGALSSTEIMNFTDAQIRALEKAALLEEETEGIKF